MSQIVIKAEHIAKKFELRVGKTGSLRDLLTLGLGRFFSKKSQTVEKREHWALRDVSFDIAQGDVVGILGRNGAGKSTLLKILSRISPLTSGRVEITGRVASLLEVGTGFHPELTGRENIFLNGSVLGMMREEIRRKFDEIVAFSGIEQFIDTPVKHYSSGMYVRLAFAVAAHLEPEILIIDEVLAVGDAEFQKKCLGKMNEVAGGGRTVIFVSHNMGAVRDLCKRAIVLGGGYVACEGDVNKCVDFYLQSVDGGVSSEGEIQWALDKAPGKFEFRLRAVRLRNAKGECKSVFSYEEPVQVEIEYQLLEKTVDMRLNFRLLTDENLVLCAATTDGREQHTKEAGVYRATVLLPSHLLNQGAFKVLLHAECPRVKELLEGFVCLQFNIEKLVRSGARETTNLPGFIAPVLDWTIDKV